MAGRWTAEPPDVVHAHFWMSGMASLPAARAVGVPVVQTFHALGVVKRRHQGADDTSPPQRIDTEA
jgi:glycogen synthase